MEKKIKFHFHFILGKTKRRVLYLSFVFFIFINANGLRPGTYSKYPLTEYPGGMFHPHYWHYIDILEDSTFRWYRFGVESPLGDSLIGYYKITGDTLILNSTETKHISIDHIPGNSFMSYRRIFVENTDGDPHPFYVTSIDSQNNTVTRFGKGCIAVPRNELIIDIEDAFDIPIKIDVAQLHDNPNDIKIYVSEYLVFEDEKWIIEGDSIYYRNKNGHINPNPLVLNGNVSSKEKFFMTPSATSYDNGFLFIFKKQNNIKYIELAKKYNYNTKGLILDVYCKAKNGISARGTILVDTNTMMEPAEINPVMVGTWTYYNTDDSIIKTEEMPYWGIPFYPEEYMIKLSNTNEERITSLNIKI